MKRFSPYCLLLLTLLLGACTNARWMVKDTSTTDPQDFRLLSSRQFLSVAQPPTPEDPTLQLQTMSKDKYEYAQKVVMARYVQEYKMRPLFFSLGVVGAATAFYLANSNGIDQIEGRLETVTLNAVGGLIALSTILNFDPSGEPKPTGEERFLRTSGNQIRTDTTKVTNAGIDSALVDIAYGDSLVSQSRQVGISQGQLAVNLGSILSQLEISDTNPDSVLVEVDYSDSTFTFSYPLQTVLHPFARVKTPVTELRNAPEETLESVLAELVEGSQLQIVEETGDQWYKVLYGIAENYISKDDVSLIWRTSDFAEENQVVAVPTVPFGEIDVENNIPILKQSNPKGIALLIGNEDYRGSYSPRKYTHRDLQLVDRYLVNALGYPESRIHRLENVTTRQPVDSVLATIGQTATDSTELFIYLSGYGTFQEVEGAYDPTLMLTAGESPQAINLNRLYKRISALPSRSTVILNNIDFSQAFNDLNREEGVPLQTVQQPLQNTAITLASEKDRWAMLFSSQFDQATHVYLGNGQQDKKHHIFPYYFAKALQQRNTSVGEIFQYLQRNVSYTARKLHNQPEEPLLFGNRSIDLAGE